jgi:uncharacterized repeat protein (TIGR03803 family)
MVLLTVDVGLAEPRLMMTTVVPASGLNDQTVYSELAVGKDGLLYGAIYNGGVFNCGSIFRTTVDGTVSTFASFDGTNGLGAYSAPVQAPDGNWYGFTQSDKGIGAGKVYRINTNGVITSLFSFDGTNGGNPQDLIIGADGNLYGLTASGGEGFDGTPGSGNGTAFKLGTNGVFTHLANFAHTNLVFPQCLVQAGDGNFYGTTQQGGDFFLGSVFRMTLDGEISTLFSFNGTNGISPGRMVLASDGSLYGVTPTGGTRYDGNWLHSWGTIFKASTNGEVSILNEFNGTNGGWCYGRLSEASNGVLVGTTYWGGSSYYGTLFKITTTGQLDDLIQFDKSRGKNGIPWAGVTKGGDGNFYACIDSPSVLACFRPLQAPVVQSIVKGDQITFTWQAWAGYSYAIATKQDLSKGWQYILGAGVDAVTNGLVSYSVPLGTNAQQFYSPVMVIPEHWW